MTTLPETAIVDYARVRLAYVDLRTRKFRPANGGESRYVPASFKITIVNPS